MIIPSLSLAVDFKLLSVGLMMKSPSNAVEIREKGEEAEIVSYETNVDSLAEFNLNTSWGEIGYAFDTSDNDSESYFIRKRIFDNYDLSFNHFNYRGGTSNQDNPTVDYPKFKTRGYNFVGSYYLRDGFLAYKEGEDVAFPEFPWSSFLSIRVGENKIVLPDELANYSSQLGNEVIFNYDYSELSLLAGVDAALRGPTKYFGGRLGLGLSYFDLKGNRNGSDFTDSQTTFPVNFEMYAGFISGNWGFDFDFVVNLTTLRFGDIAYQDEKFQFDLGVKYLF